MESDKEDTTAQEIIAQLPKLEDCDADLLAEVERLSEFSDRDLYEAWGWGPSHSFLFDAVGVNPSDEGCACLTQVREGYACGVKDEVLVDAIKADAEIPKATEIRPHHLARFAQWRTLIRRRYAESQNAARSSNPESTP